MDGYDIRLVLTGEVDLKDLLANKIAKHVVPYHAVKDYVK